MLNRIGIPILILFFVGCTDSSSVTNLPVYPNAYEIKHYTDDTFGVVGVFCKVKVDYPALKVIEFYENFASSDDYLPYPDDGYAMHRWEQFNPKTAEWDESQGVPARYIGSWTDSQKTKRIVLTIRCGYDVSNKNGKSVLWVDYKEMPFFDIREIEALESTQERFQKMIEELREERRKGTSKD